MPRPGRRDRRGRKQRIVLRERRKSEIRGRLGSTMRRLGTMLGVGTIVFAGFVYLRPALQSLAVQWRPMVSVTGPLPTAEAASVRKLIEDEGTSVWWPGTTQSLKRSILGFCPEIRSVNFYRDFFTKQINAKLIPRVPLLRIGDRAIDREGAAFPVAPERLANLPLVVKAFTTKRNLGIWAEAMSKQKVIWSQVVSIVESTPGELTLNLQTGERILWGDLDTSIISGKCANLQSIIVDARERFGAFELTDARFSEEGRFIVRPSGHRKKTNSLS